MLGWFFFPLNWIGALTLSLTKTASRKLEAWFVLWSFFLLSRLFIMEYCCQVWAGAPSCYLHMLDKLQIWICRTVVSTLAAFLEPLDHHQNVVIIIFFYRHYFGRYSSRLVELVPLPYFWGWSTCDSYRLHDFSVNFPRYYQDVYVNSFLLHTTTTFWNSLPAEYFNRNGFEFRIDMHFSSLGSV